jgi:hypothetical protein
MKKKAQWGVVKQYAGGKAHRDKTGDVKRLRPLRLMKEAARRGRERKRKGGDE